MAKKSKSETDQADEADQATEEQAVQTVKMYREAPTYPGGPTEADVHIEEVALWSQHGWSKTKPKPEE